MSTLAIFHLRDSHPSGVRFIVLYSSSNIINRNRWQQKIQSVRDHNAAFAIEDMALLILVVRPLLLSVLCTSMFLLSVSNKHVLSSPLSLARSFSWTSSTVSMRMSSLAYALLTPRRRSLYSFTRQFIAEKFRLTPLDLPKGFPSLGGELLAAASLDILLLYVRSL